MHLRTRQSGLISVFCALCALWLWLSAAVTHAQGGPTLQANPTGGVAGNAIKLGGSGFAPGGYEGTLLWDGAPVETILIPTGGSFIRDFILPVDAAPGDHLITICRGSPCLVGADAQQASTTLRVTATAPHLSAKVAYVYQADAAAAKGFGDLLGRHGMTVKTVPLDEVLKTDFRQFALTIIADDTGKLDVWGNADGQVSQIAKNSKVLGIGEGGYAFFGRLGLAIGHPRGSHGSALDIYAVDSNLAIYRTPYNLGLGRGGLLQVYRDNVANVALSATSLGSNTFATGYQDANGTFSILVSQGCNQLWGFTGDPGKMTAAGRNLFINSVQQALRMPCSGVTLQNPCQELLTAADIGGAGLITFDDLPEATTIENYYAALYDVRFENSSTARVITYGKEPDKAESRPNVAWNEALAPATNASVPLVITFAEPKSHVGFYMGNGETQQPNGLLTAYDVTGKLLCRALNTVPEPHTEFIGLYDAYGRIASIQLEYNSDLPESIDNLAFAPNPQNWRIQLCQESANRCPPAVGTVYRANPTTGGDAFGVDAQGYVLGAGQIDVGDQLWGLEALTKTANATLYRTSTIEVVGADVISPSVQAEPATLRLVVKQQQPLLVQDLTISAEWYVQGDAQRAEWLRANLVKAANYLYSFTDGQFTLGRITVQQSLDGWTDADLRLHLNNVLQPKANIGGIVTVDTPDPLVAFTYSPGHVFMGSAWNRYGVPPNQQVKVKGIPVSPATMVDDWAIAMAHELGHYLLFLFDTYTGIDGQASQELADRCTGTAMGDAYKPSNHNFIFRPDHWQSACAGTEAHHTLKGRTEWETIRLWYPWVIQPTAVVTGPVAPPANLTTVTFLAPSTPPGEPATSQLFDMIYEAGELTSGEARVFTFRGDRLFEQGKPPKNATQVQLIDAQVADRLCVYDVNDHAEGGDTPRHQFGCEPIQPGDAELQMTKNTAWEPLIALTQVSTTSLRLAVTQTLPAGAQVVAKLYPEHGTALPQQTLTASGGAYSHVFDFGGPVTPVYAQVWIDETPGGLTTRREVVADRGTGGSGAFGPASRLSGVLVVSSDGKASFESDQPLRLSSGQSIAWQSMPGTPPLPIGRAIMGQSYRLDAFPSSLVASGQIFIEYEEHAVLQSATNSGVEAAEPAIYFWDGASWRALPTAATKPVNAEDGVKVASAPSQGVGVYAVLLDLGQNQLFLPLIQR
jgi:hypothetical protein